MQMQTAELAKLDDICAHVQEKGFSSHSSYSLPKLAM